MIVKSNSARRPEVSLASSYHGLSSGMRADPKTVTQGPAKCSPRKPRTNSPVIFRTRPGSKVLDGGRSRNLSSGIASEEVGD